MHKVVITSANGRDLVDCLTDRHPVEVVDRTDLESTDDLERLSAALSGAWAVIAGSEPYTAALFDAVPRLRAVLRFGVGYDAVDIAAAGDRDIAVCVTAGANAEAVADMALMLMLACVRELPELERAARNGTWRPTTPSHDLALACVAIVGFGAVGRAVATRLRGFGCRLLAVDPAVDGDACAALGAELVGLEEALERADVVTLHAALTPDSRHLLGREQLARLSSHAVIVNTSRGQLIDEDALIDALGTRRVAAAGLDVFESEPLGSESPLLSLPNVIVSGHVSSFSLLGIRATADAIVKQLSSLLAGTRPAGCLTAPSWLRASN
jgi:phosphoglycerate dehydrogenase-like enzyme